MSEGVIKVDVDECVGHGKCYFVAPELMDSFDDEGRAKFVGPTIDSTDEKTTRLAEKIVLNCPQEALSLHWSNGD